jgi:hypothetical protein
VLLELGYIEHIRYLWVTRTRHRREAVVIKTAGKEPEKSRGYSRTHTVIIRQLGEETTRQASEDWRNDPLDGGKGEAA